MKKLKLAALTVLVLLTSGVTATAWSGDGRGGDDYGSYGYDDGEDGNDGEGDDGEDDDGNGGGGGGGNLGRDSGNGSALYAQACASCHGASGRLRGTSVSGLSKAISRNKGGMGYLSYLAASDIQSIAGYINGVTAATQANYTAASSGAGAAGTGTGAGLYAQYCSSCHGANGKRGATTTTISNAISSNAGGMIYLSSLTATQVQEIANHLSGTATTASYTAAPSAGAAGTGTGAGLYAQYCSSCHGANGKRGATTTTISNAISGNAGGMIFLSSLTTNQIQEIATYLSGAATTSGATATQGSGTAAPIADTRVFAYAEANHRSLFAGVATTGRHQQYSYRHYPDSGNYLAVDSAGEIFIFGPYTGGVLTPIGSVESIRRHITDWETTSGREAALGEEAASGDEVTVEHSRRSGNARNWER